MSSSWETFFSVLPPGVFLIWYWNRRNELTSRINSIISDINSMTDKGVEYWNRPRNEDKDLDMEANIKSLSKRIGKDITSTRKEFRLFKFKNHPKTVAFRQAIMSSSFESASRNKDLERCEIIFQARDVLVLALRFSQKWI